MPTLNWMIIGWSLENLGKSLENHWKIVDYWIAGYSIIRWFLFRTEMIRVDQHRPTLQWSSGATNMLTPLPQGSWIIIIEYCVCVCFCVFFGVVNSFFTASFMFVSKVHLISRSCRVHLRSFWDFSARHLKASLLPPVGTVHCMWIRTATPWCYDPPDGRWFPRR